MRRDAGREGEEGPGGRDGRERSGLEGDFGDLFSDDFNLRLNRFRDLEV
jgi:hypothetical protein